MEKENAEYLRRLAGSDNSKGPKAHQVTDISRRLGVAGMTLYETNRTRGLDPARNAGAKAVVSHILL
ncbi:hypothetical protein CGMCC3_g7953 [Colletotrichum fructicola]|nr:uncharacterized protein CGMCC3_g7953 [Colletotrichum fructicola]KAE9576305.1 hypothetical protein CGMCC3_g7953 [Colletotrichum fructicola]